MKRLYSVFIFLFLSTISYSQSSLIELPSEQSVKDFISFIEQNTGRKVYYSERDIEGARIGPGQVGSDPVAYLAEHLKKYGLNVTVYQDNVFITAGVSLRTGTVGNYTEGLSDAFAAGYTFNDDSTTTYIKAGSEAKVYVIGNPYQSRKGVYTISGTVLDFKTGEIVPDAIIAVHGAMAGTQSDRYGKFTMNLTSGRNKILISGLGVEPTERNIMVFADGTVDIEVEGTAVELDEITIRHDRAERVRSNILGAEKFQMQEVKNIPTVFGEADVMRILSTLPGVRTVGEMSGGLNIRGGSTDQNLILFNGGTIYNPTHLFGFFSSFNPDVVEDMELYKSSVPAKYGGRLSAVLDIKGKEGNYEKFGASASIGVITSRLSVTGPFAKGKSSFLLAGRTTYSDWILRQLPQKSGYRDGNGGFYDLNFSLNNRITEKANLDVSGYYSKDRFNFGKTDKFYYKNGNGSIAWRQRYNHSVMSKLTLGYDHYDHTSIENSEKYTSYKFWFGIDQVFAKLDMLVAINDKHTVEFGINETYYNYKPGMLKKYKSVESKVRPQNLPREEALESAVYFAYNWDITRKLSLNLGVRYSLFSVMGPRDYYEYIKGEIPSETSVVREVEGKSGVMKNYHGPEYRLSARYEFIDGFSIKGGFNTMRQYIHKISNSTIMAPTDTWKLSDMNIKPQTGNQYSLGLYKNFFNGKIETSVEGYYKTMKNFADYRGGAELVMNPNIEQDLLPVKGKAYGIEVMVRKTSGKLNGWLSYTYSRTKLRQDGKKITDPVNNGDWYPSDFDKPHEIKFTGNYKFTERYILSMNMEYSTGRPVTIPVSKYTFNGKEYFYFTDRNKYRIPDFFRTDIAFTIEPKHRMTQLSHSSFTVGIYNVTGRKNAYSVFYRTENNMGKCYKLSIIGVPIPYASYNIRF